MYYGRGLEDSSVLFHVIPIPRILYITSSCPLDYTCYFMSSQPWIFTQLTGAGVQRMYQYMPYFVRRIKVSPAAGSLEVGERVVQCAISFLQTFSPSLL